MNLSIVEDSKFMNVVILAAGLGKRMHSDLPKVLQLLGRHAGDSMEQAFLNCIESRAHG